MTSGVCVKTQALFIWIFTGITRKLKNLVTKALEADRNISADEPAHPEAKLAQAHSPAAQRYSTFPEVRSHIRRKQDGQDAFP